MEEKRGITDFVMLPRKIRDSRLEGKITRNEYDILNWIWVNTNPYNGYFTADYKALEREFDSRISYDNVRKIISSLRQSQYVYFVNHKGRGGSFPIYPLDFTLTSGKIQTLEYLKNKSQITTQLQSPTQPNAQLENNLPAPNNNFEDMKKSLIEGFSMNEPKIRIKQITTPYNDNDNKNKKENIDYKFSDNKLLSVAYKKKVIPVESFFPKSWEDEQCLDIAKKLGETDMRFLLSCLKGYGFNHIERVWGIFKDLPKEKIENPRKYFNKLIRNFPQK